MADISEDSARNRHLSLPTYKERFLYTLIKNIYFNYHTLVLWLLLLQQGSTSVTTQPYHRARQSTCTE